MVVVHLLHPKCVELVAFEDLFKLEKNHLGEGISTYGVDPRDSEGGVDGCSGQLAQQLLLEAGTGDEVGGACDDVGADGGGGTALV